MRRPDARALRGRGLAGGRAGLVRLRSQGAPAREVAGEVAVRPGHLDELPALRPELVDLRLGTHLQADAQDVVLEAAGRAQIALPALLLEACLGVAVVGRSGKQTHGRQLIAPGGGPRPGAARLLRWTVRRVRRHAE